MAYATLISANNMPTLPTCWLTIAITLYLFDFYKIGQTIQAPEQGISAASLSTPRCLAGNKAHLFCCCWNKYAGFSTTYCLFAN